MFPCMLHCFNLVATLYSPFRHSIIYHFFSLFLLESILRKWKIFCSGEIIRKANISVCSFIILIFPTPSFTWSSLFWCFHFFSHYYFFMNAFEESWLFCFRGNIPPSHRQGLHYSLPIKKIPKNSTWNPDIPQTCSSIL